MWFKMKKCFNIIYHINFSKYAYKITLMERDLIFRDPIPKNAHMCLLCRNILCHPSNKPKIYLKIYGNKYKRGRTKPIKKASTKTMSFANTKALETEKGNEQSNFIIVAQ